MYFTNRALCQLKLSRWELVCTDCRRALDMDPELIKGHFFLGQALLETEAYDEAIKHLQRGIVVSKIIFVNFKTMSALFMVLYRRIIFKKYVMLFRNTLILI